MAEIFDDLSIAAPFVPKDREHIYYRYVVLLENAERFMDCDDEKRGGLQETRFQTSA